MSRAGPAQGNPIPLNCIQYILDPAEYTKASEKTSLSLTKSMAWQLEEAVGWWKGIYYPGNISKQLELDSKVQFGQEAHISEDGLSKYLSLSERPLDLLPTVISLPDPAVTCCQIKYVIGEPFLPELDVCPKDKSTDQVEGGLKSFRNRVTLDLSYKLQLIQKDILS